MFTPAQNEWFTIAPRRNMRGLLIVASTVPGRLAMLVGRLANWTLDLSVHKTPPSAQGHGWHLCNKRMKGQAFALSTRLSCRFCCDGNPSAEPGEETLLLA